MKKKLFIGVFGIFLMFFGIIGVKAADINSFTIEVELSNKGTVASGIEINVIGEFEEDSLYYLKFVNEKDSKPEDIPENWRESVETSNTDITKWKNLLVSPVIAQAKVHNSDDWFLLNGYNYAYIMQCNSETCSVTDKPLKIERPELPELGKRYQVYYSDSDGIQEKTQLSFFPLFPYSGKNGSHTIEIKIGVINDEELLYSIYKNEANASSKLLEYAKKKDGKKYEMSDDVLENKNISISDLNVINGSYYYLYTTYKNSEGLYRDLSDVSIAMGKHNWLVNDVKWNFDEEKDQVTPEITEKQEENPKTADINNNLALLVLAGSLGLVVIGKKKLKKLSK